MKKRIFLAGCFSFFIFSSGLFPCTAFFANRKGRMMVGNNEDYWATDSKIWFLPPRPGIYGRVYVGFGDFSPEGGINEKGLFFDGFSVPYVRMDMGKGKPFFQGRLYDKVLSECANVDEALKVLDAYNPEVFATGMWMLADAAGHSVIFEGDRIVGMKGDYQIVTNFRPSRLPAGKEPCRRYKRADALLREGGEISGDLFRRILSETRQNNTQYSYICDLKTLQFTLFHFHRFDPPRVFDLREEWKRGEHDYEMASLFPRNEELFRLASAKRTPQASWTVRIVMALCALTFLATLLFGIPVRLIRYRREKNIISILSWVVAAVGSASHLLFFGLPLTFPQFLVYGPPHDLYYMTFPQKCVFWIPFASLVMTLFLGLLIAILLKNRYGSGFSRVFLWLPFLASLASLLLYLYWGMLRYYC